MFPIYEWVIFHGYVEQPEATHHMLGKFHWFKTLDDLLGKSTMFEGYSYWTHRNIGILEGHVRWRVESVGRSPVQSGAPSPNL